MQYTPIYVKVGEGIEPEVEENNNDPFDLAKSFI
jgi:hypothetical protein